MVIAVYVLIILASVTQSATTKLFNQNCSHSAVFNAMKSCAALGGFESIDGIRASRVASKAASLLRKVYFANGKYERAGWSRQEIGDIF